MDSQEGLGGIPPSMIFHGLVDLKRNLSEVKIGHRREARNSESLT